MSAPLLLSLLLPAAHAAASVGAAPTEITMAVTIDAPVEDVWAELARIGDIGLNSPTVARSWVSSDAATGVGATRHMEMSLKPGATLDERVVVWEKGTYMALEVDRIVGVPGVRTMGGDFRVAPSGGATVLTSTLHYSMTNGMTGLMNRLVMKRRFADLWRSVLAGYKHHIETGEEVTADTALTLDAVAFEGMVIGADAAGGAR